jgi:hypothetical protein
MENPLPRVVIMTPVTPDFRVGPIETEVRDDGSTVTFQVCEELLDGRWEGFITIIEDTRDFCPECGTHKAVCQCDTRGDRP